MKKQWMNPEMATLGLEATQTQQKGLLACGCRVNGEVCTEYIGEFTNSAELEAALLAHKRTHGYTGNDPYTKVCAIS